mmetsp:Transcript_50349/g.155652  ORF Transcript_50349/g.155652 Transcript_50349/m.155652 type:complete len:379 (+) Transcript_50349:280-1416(+)
MQHGLPEDEDAAADGRGEVHGQELRGAVVLQLRRVTAGCRASFSLAPRYCARRLRVVLLLVGGCRHADVRVDAHVLRQGQLPHVVLRVEREVEVPELDPHDRSLHAPAVHRLVRVLREQLVHLLRECVGNAQVGCAGVQDATASAVVADVQLVAIDVQREDLHLPIAQLRLEHGHPLERLQQPRGVVPADGYLALLAGIAVCEEDAKVGVADLSAARQNPEEAEVRGERQAAEAQAHDAVKVEELERPPRHVDRHDHLRVHAGPPAPSLRAEPVLRPRRRAQADSVTHKLACDLPRAEADGHLVAQAPLVRRHRGAIQVDGRGGGRRPDVVAPVLQAGVRAALHRGQDDVPGSRVEHHSELLRQGAAYVDDPRVRGLE